MLKSFSGDLQLALNISRDPDTLSSFFAEDSTSSRQHRLALIAKEARLSRAQDVLNGGNLSPPAAREIGGADGVGVASAIQEAKGERQALEGDLGGVFADHTTILSE
jgi:hypothetical protein